MSINPVGTQCSADMCLIDFPKSDLCLLISYFVKDDSLQIASMLDYITALDNHLLILEIIDLIFLLCQSCSYYWTFCTKGTTIPQTLQNLPTYRSSAFIRIGMDTGLVEFSLFVRSLSV